MGGRPCCLTVCVDIKSSVWFVVRFMLSLFYFIVFSLGGSWTQYDASKTGVHMPPVTQRMRPSSTCLTWCCAGLMLVLYYDLLF